MTEDFAGHDGRDCGDHRTTGERAWCFDCSEWCYPDVPCSRCGYPMLRRQAANDLGRFERIAEAHAKHVGQGGLTSGCCNECDLPYPCPTYVWATTERDPLSTWDPDDDKDDEHGNFHDQ